MGSVFKRVRGRSARHLRKGAYYVKFRTADGRWVRECAKTASREAAEDLLRRREDAAARGATPGRNVLFGDAAERWLRDYSAVRLRSHAFNVHRYGKHLAEPFGALRLRDVNAAAIKAFASRKLREGLAPASVRRVLALLRVIINAAVQDGLLAESPFMRIKRGQLPAEPKGQEYDWFTAEEVGKLIEAAPVDARAFYATAAYTGLRHGELCGLRWTDLDLDAGLLSVARSYDKPTTKSGKPRKVPIGAALRPLLVAWKANAPASPGGLVFPNPGTGGMLDPKTRRHEFREACRRAGVRLLRLHDLRHTFATHFMRTGGNVYRLKAILGHSTIALTERYSHHAPEWAQPDVDRLDFTLRPAEVTGLLAERRRRAAASRQGAAK